MTNRPRIIPGLTILNKQLVKTKKYKAWKYLGDPINAIRIFNEKNADELSITDITDAPPDFEFIEQMVSECFMPVCYSGALRSVDDIQKVLALGVEKISLRTMALENPTELQKAISMFGSSAIVVKLDIQKTIFGLKLLSSSRTYYHSETTIKGIIQNIIDLGVGELILQSVSADGTLLGFDFSLLTKYSEGCSIPCLISGGCSSNSNIQDAFHKKFDGVVVGRHFVLKPPQNGVLIQYPSEELFETIVGDR